jgi:hypothetical protein
MQAERVAFGFGEGGAFVQKRAVEKIEPGKIDLQGIIVGH